MTPEGTARQKAAGGTYVKQTGFGSASEMGPYDRCISRGVVGSMMPVVYNNGNEIVQAPGVAAFQREVVHGRFARPLRGNVLVVRTTNLNGKTGMQGNGMMLIPSDSLELVERFIPLSANVLQYEVSINDPKTWTQRWKVSFPLRRDPSYGMFEYACHEGNHAMRNILSASRADERS